MLDITLNFQESKTPVLQDAPQVQIAQYSFSVGCGVWKMVKTFHDFRFSIFKTWAELESSVVNRKAIFTFRDFLWAVCM